MATISNILGCNFEVQVNFTGNVYSHPATINTTRAVTITQNVEVDELVDIDDMCGPAQTYRRARSSDVKIDGSGLVHAPDQLKFHEWSHKGLVHNVKVVTPGANGVTISGPFLCTTFQKTGDRTKSIEAQITLEQAGPVTITQTGA